MLLYEKYTPYSLNGMIGNRLSMDKLRQFGEQVLAHKKPKPIMVYGPSGTGKTTAIRAIAYSNGFELVELTSSDYRDAETLRKKLLPAVSSRGLFGNVNLILFDEIDELSSKFDQGAEAVILQILKEAKQPIAFTANDFWDRRISFLRNHVDKAEFKKVETREISALMKRITVMEKTPVSDDLLNEISARSDGDVRGALNDLQMVMLGGKEILENLGIRNRKLEIFRVLDRIFLTNDFFGAKTAIDTSEIELDMLINWIDENIPNRYWIKQFVSKSYSELAFASRFCEMAERVRYYGYMKYAAIGIAGISISSGGSTKFLSPYSFPSKVKYFSITKENRSMQTKIATKLSPFLHTNRHEIVHSYIPMFKKILANASEEEKKSTREMFENSIMLEKEELEFLTSAV
jgi:replication factor C large subunit